MQCWSLKNLKALFSDVTVWTLDQEFCSCSESCEMIALFNWCFIYIDDKTLGFLPQKCTLWREKLFGLLYMYLYICYVQISVVQSCPTFCGPMDCSRPDPTVHGISQVRILEWIAISFSRGSSWSRIQAFLSLYMCISAGEFLGLWRSVRLVNASEFPRKVKLTLHF